MKTFRIIVKDKEGREKFNYLSEAEDHVDAMDIAVTNLKVYLNTFQQIDDLNIQIKDAQDKQDIMKKCCQIMDAGKKNLTVLKLEDYNEGIEEIYLIRTKMNISELETAVLDAREKLDEVIHEEGDDYNKVMEYLEEHTDIEYISHSQVTVNI